MAKEHKKSKNTKHKKESKKNKKDSVWQIATLVLGVLFIISIFTGGFGITKSSSIGADEAAQIAIDYINSNLLAPGTKAELISSEQEGDLYHLVISIAGQEFDSYISIDGKTLFPSAVELEEQLVEKSAETETSTQSTTEENSVTGTAIEENVEVIKIQGTSSFTVNDDKVCEENGKPLVMLFSTTWCPHCKWISETFDSTVESYGDSIASYHWDLDTGDNILTEEVETEIPTELNALYEKYNPKGSIPTFVFGCKYSRTGNGYESQNDLAKEEEEFRYIIDGLIA